MQGTKASSSKARISLWTSPIWAPPDQWTHTWLRTLSVPLSKVIGAPWEGWA